MVALSEETVRLQNEWSGQLGGVCAELQAATRLALQHHDAYRAAMGRVADLYAQCGKILLLANTPAIGLASPISTAKDARRVAAHVQLSMNQWRQSSDETALRVFMQRQGEEWAMWEKEIRQSYKLNVKRDAQLQGTRKLQQQLRAAGSSAGSYVVASMKGAIEDAEESRAKMDRKITQEKTEQVRMCSRSLITMSTELVDHMSRCGQVCAVSFQPIETVQLRPLSAQTSTASFHSPTLPTDTVVGVVMDRPEVSEDVNDASEATDGVSFARSYTYLREASLASPTLSAAANRSAHQEPETRES